MPESTRRTCTAGRWLLSLALTLPVVSTAQEPAPEPDYTTAPLSPTLTLLVGRGGNVAISAGADGVFLIDDQLQPLAGQLLAEVRRISDAPVRFVINTHYHSDHMGGNEAAGAAGAVIIAHDNVRKRLTTEQFSSFMERTTPPWPAGALPVVTFSDRVTLHLNGEPAQVIHVPHGHTDGDAIIHFPDSDVIHMGDIFFNGTYPYIDLDAGGSVQGMIAAVQAALQRAGPDTRIIPGHGPLASRSELAAYGAMLATARDRVQALIDQGQGLTEVIAARPTAQWDATLGAGWLKPEQFVTFVYNSLTGVPHYSRVPSTSPR